MKGFIKQSFEQNPEALTQLLATGNSKLTHTQDKGKWGTEFPRLLMEVRDELSPTQKTFDNEKFREVEKLFEEIEREPIVKFENNNPKDYTNHSGGAYGGDTFWDLIGREFGVTNHRHYKDADNANLSKQLRSKGVKAEVLTKEQMDFARQKVKELLGVEYNDDLKGNLQVRNFYQVYNSDGVFAVAKLNDNKSEVLGGTNTTVKLSIKLDKPTYVWDINSEGWYKFTPNIDLFGNSTGGGFIKVDTPTLTENFAGVGSRDIENYSILNKQTNQ